VRVRVLDLDASLLEQPTLRSAVGRGDVGCVRLRDIGSQLRLVASRPALRELARRLADDDRASDRAASVSFVGSGDFHHVTAVLLARLRDPVTVIHVDNHPDWVCWPRTFNCGGWVSRALDLPHVRRIVTLGPCSQDLSFPELKLANLQALASGRLEVYPWRREESRVLRGYGEGASHVSRGGRLIWTTLAERNWEDFVRTLLATVPTEAIYLTIDKDALREADAATNWDQGEMPLDHVLRLIERIAATRRLVGADVCGEYSPPTFAGVGRRLLSWLDRGSLARKAPWEYAQNEITNRRLLAAFRRCAS